MRYFFLSSIAALALFIPGNPSAIIRYLPKNDTAVHDILRENLDQSVSPSQDFFQYANGGWIKRNPIPDDQSAWGIGNAVEEELYKRLKTINVQSLKSTT